MKAIVLVAAATKTMAAIVALSRDGRRQTRDERRGSTHVVKPGPSGDREVRISRPSWNSVHSEKPSAQVYYMYRVALSARRTTAVPVETLA